MRKSFFFLMYFFILLPAIATAEINAVKSNILSSEYRTLAQAVQVTPPLDRTPTEQAPIGTKKGAEADGEERKSGYIHPFFSITQYYTDNVLNTRDDRKSEFVTILSPGVWISLPRNKVIEPEKEIETSNTAPGGLDVGRILKRYPGTYQSYFMYKGDYEYYARGMSENFLNHNIQAGVQYNFKGGLTLDAVDQFLRTHNSRGTGLFFTLDKYYANLFNTSLSYETAGRFKLRLDYSNYYLHYSDDFNAFRNRSDNSASAYVFYQTGTKTSLFVQYEYVDVSYKEDILSDSKEHHFFGGMMWKITEKSKGLFKAGYGTKNFSDPLIKNHSDLYLEAQIEHAFTPKTTLKITAKKRTDESDIELNQFMVMNSIKAEYLQWLRSKIAFAVNLEYMRNIYDGTLTIDNVTKGRKDSIYSAAVALRLEARKWLKFDLAYIYTKRNSNFDDFDYKNNTIMLRGTATL